jgi:RHS repeat-associated protein
MWHAICAVIQSTCHRPPGGWERAHAGGRSSGQTPIGQGRVGSRREMPPAEIGRRSAPPAFFRLPHPLLGWGVVRSIPAISIIVAMSLFSAVPFPISAAPQCLSAHAFQTSYCLRLVGSIDGTTRITYEYTVPGDKTYDQRDAPLSLVKKTTWEMYDGDKKAWAAFKSVAYQHDSHGRRREMTEPDGGIVTYVYEADRLWRMVRKETPEAAPMLCAEYEYDRGGRLVKTTFGNGTSKNIRYDDAGRVERIEQSAAGGKMLSMIRYAYDSRGNRTRIDYDHLGVYVEYEYDELNRLLREYSPGNEGGTPQAPPFTNRFASRPGGNEGEQSDEVPAVAATPVYPAVAAYEARYWYDAAGNREYKQDSRLGLFAYAYDAQNKLTDETGSLPNNATIRYKYDFDQAGNMTKRYEVDAAGAQVMLSPVHGYGYDYRNCMIAYTRKSNGFENAPVEMSGAYVYAPTGERVTKTVNGSTTAFMYDGADVVADYVVPAKGTYTPTRTYLQGLGIDSKFAQIEADASKTTHYYDADALGSVHQVIDGFGQDASAQELHLRTAWGEDVVGGASMTRYSFTQRENDEESGLMYFRARHYSPRLGRFVQRDPLYNSVIAEHYRYANNNPLLYTDPEGELFFLPAIAIGVKEVIVVVAATGAAAAISNQVRNHGRDIASEIGSGTSRVGRFFGRVFNKTGKFLAANPPPSEMRYYSNPASPYLEWQYRNRNASYSTNVGKPTGSTNVNVPKTNTKPPEGGTSSNLNTPKPNEPKNEPINEGKLMVAKTLTGAPESETQIVKLSELRRTQSTIGKAKAAYWRKKIADEGGYTGDPIDVVKTPDGLATLDHTRATVSLEQGFITIQARVHLPSEPLPASMIGRFGAAKTWGEAAAYRAANQVPPLPPTGLPGLPPLPRPGG